jgi:GNAT superfamily N-acetyltransferase
VTNYSLQQVDKLDSVDQRAIEHGSRATEPGGGKTAYAPLLVTLRDAAGKLVGGLIANTGSAWCYIGAVWVGEAERRQGWGSQLLAAAEAEAQRRGCRHAYLNTFSDQAVDFYQRNGYRTFAVLEDFPGERSRVFLRKDFS